MPMMEHMKKAPPIFCARRRSWFQDEGRVSWCHLIYFFASSCKLRPL